MKKKLKIGDKVEVKDEPGCAKIAGMRGVIKDIDTDDECAVEFDKKKPFFGSCNGKCKPNRGFWIYMKHLKLFVENKVTYVKYEAGTKISDYVKKILKLEKDEQRLKWLRSFDNCVLPESVRDSIDEALTIVLRADLFDKWGINDKFEKGLTNSILIYGPPGTGKTMVSESIASVLGKNLLKITTATIQSNVPGRTEKNISECFKRATEENAVILIDECDSILYNRNAVGQIMAAEINHFLGELENFAGVAILTTNRLHKLDNALERRIISKIELEIPTEEARVKIWGKLIPDRLPIGKVDFKKLSKPEMSGGDIKNSILLAVRKAISKNKDIIGMNHFKDGVNAVLKAKHDFTKNRGRKVDEDLYFIK